MSELRRTPLYAAHVRLKARLVPFAGFELPIQYTSIREEHTAVRERAGLFDVSHMGQIYFSGAKACETLERLLTCAVDSLKVGCARYGLLLNESGGCIDDVMLTREAEDLYFLCVNASNVESARGWIESQVGIKVGLTPEAESGSDLQLEDRSDQTALLALQGPAAKAILTKLGPDESELPKRFRVARFNLAGADTLVSGTGYTGSPGYELYVSNADAEKVFEAILEVGATDGVFPAGLGARDTLRLEAALALHGHELDDQTTPFEAGLDRFVKPLDSGFIGAEALASKAAANDPNARSLIGFEMTERGIARADYEIVSAGEVIGRVTSGTPSPTLGKSIGLGYVPRSQSEVGRMLAIRIRNKDVAAKIVERPFV
ncbi:MAG TPA: glycine cleavage system aminomethyltransferase GcvT [Myxococcales bacterium]|nr:glycine cleavage system aminomethyltransferase GcvT [Myxococcales bacterium]